MAWKCCSGQYLTQKIFIILAFYFSTCKATGRMDLVFLGFLGFLDFFMECSRETEILIEVEGEDFKDYINECAFIGQIYG